MKNLFLFSFVLLSTIYTTAQDTFSIVAIDPITGEVGSAGASCIDDPGCGGCGGAIIISDLVPGKGAMNAQAQVCIPNSNLQNGISYIQAGQDANQVLANTLANDACAFGDTSMRQYGIAVIDTTGTITISAFTGQGATVYRNHTTGFNFATQGNILLGQEILDSIAARFQNTQGDLACKLMSALQGANVPGADTRCLTEGTSSQSAFIRVAQPSDTPGNFSLDLNVPSTPFGVEPIDSLQVLFDAAHTCQVVSNKEQTLAKKQIKVYPNPASDQLTFEVDGAVGSYQLAIYNSEGKRMLAEKKFSGTKYHADVSGWVKGVYFYMLKDATGFVGQGSVVVE